MAFIMLGEDQGPSIVENAREFTSFENIADPDDVDPDGNPGDGTNHPERRPFIQIYHQGPASAIQDVTSSVFKVYPNPARDGQFTLNLMNGGVAQAEIISASGEVVGTYTLNQPTNFLDATKFPTGMYIIKVIQDGESYTKKLVIE
ncbi:MAG TPA: hypothetical protein DDX92_00455 [Flavobacteriales bacterium]|jgi:hypothetical protein|nr:hypothetical protein [Flavobacteriales bacterium]